jgi:hypothetical protein
MFFVTIYCHYLILTWINLFDEPYLILFISLSIAAFGALLYFLDRKKDIISKIGWGILVGAVTSSFLIFGFLMILIIALSG